MKGIIIYKGKYGATQEYADWLADELLLPVRFANEINGGELAPYDFLLIGSSVYIGKLQIQSWIKKNLPFIRDKRIYLFQVAGTPPEQKEKRDSYNRKSIPAEILDQCKTFFFPGRMIMKKLSWWDRFVLKMGARMVKDPHEKAVMLTDYNAVKKQYTVELISQVREYQQAATPAEEYAYACETRLS